MQGVFRDRNVMLDCLVDGLRNIVWLVAKEDHGVMVDLLERAVYHLNNARDDEVRLARTEARERAAREGRS